MIVTTPARAVPIATDFPDRRSSRCTGRVSHDDVIGHGLDDVVHGAMLPVGDRAAGTIGSDVERGLVLSTRAISTSARPRLGGSVWPPRRAADAAGDLPRTARDRLAHGIVLVLERLASGHPGASPCLPCARIIAARAAR